MLFVLNNWAQNAKFVVLEKKKRKKKNWFKHVVFLFHISLTEAVLCESIVCVVEFFKEKESRGKKKSFRRADLFLGKPSRVYLCILQGGQLCHLNPFSSVGLSSNIVRKADFLFRLALYEKGDKWKLILKRVFPLEAIYLYLKFWWRGC